MRIEKNSIILSEQEYGFLIGEMCKSVDAFSRGIKVERAIKKRTQDVEAIRVYLTEFNANINSTTERGESPTLLVKRTIREKTGKPEIEIVFMGSEKDRHVEKLYAKNPQDWKSFGHIVLSIPQAKRFQQIINWLVTGQTRFSL